MHKIIQTKFGLIRGLARTNVLGGNYFSFKGIPYAEPPVGKLRFQDPIPWTKNWKAVRDAIEHGNVCAQFDKITNSIHGSDDCLYLNVYTESVENEIPLPVMVWIHGGAFLFGSGNEDLYGPDYLLKRKIVLVTMNYRLDVLGFLNLGIEEVPGNQGLKDQVIALQWVKENISKFGGDPENVTIFGESAGGASVHYLTQSPLAKGLFHKAICQSGVANNTWANMHENPMHYALKLTKKLGNNSTDPVEMMEFLKTVDSHKIIEAQTTVITKLERFRLHFTSGPTTDNKSKNPFMPYPISLDSLKEIKIPLMLGYNSREGLIMLAGMNEKNFEQYDLRFPELIHPSFVDWLKERGITLQELREFYFGNRKITSKCSVEYADLVGDTLFVSGLHDVAKVQIKKKGTSPFMYQFTHDIGASFMKKVLSVSEPGACHFDEVQYLFHIGALKMLELPSPLTDATERKLMERMTKMWTDFAKTGNPTPMASEEIPLNWEPVDDTTHFKCLNIQKDLKLETIPSCEQLFLTRRKLRNKL
ncbi:esterase B1-like isoform X2 [Leptopilina heterotoma]|uniref:esterase B1-like isoform X2 n=1 Tax=Leptopilina heterotoma TaxID=63436 RepID=UPI001CA9CBD6|nr:esterase B1-like isoform X2 [Leptopilina heterotoma]